MRLYQGEYATKVSKLVFYAQSTSEDISGQTCDKSKWVGVLCPVNQWGYIRANMRQKHRESAQEWRIMLHKSDHQSISNGSYNTASMIGMQKGTQAVGTHTLWLHVTPLAWSACEKEHSRDTQSLATCNTASMIGMRKGTQQGHTVSGYM